MTETDQTPAATIVEAADADAPMPTELELLRKRATTLGVQFHTTAGVETLKKRIAEKLAGTPEGETSEEEIQEGQLTPAQEKAARRAKLQAEAFKLVRLRIANLNPLKAQLHGEIFTVGNNVLGVVKQFVPFGEKTDEGWHVKHIIYEEMKGRKFQQIKTKPDPKRPGHMLVEQRLVPEFALEVLPPLTDEERKELAAIQAAAGGL